MIDLSDILQEQGSNLNKTIAKGMHLVMAMIRKGEK